MQHPTATSHIQARELVRQKFDLVLHQRLRQIFHEHRLSTGSQIREFLRGLQHDTERDSTIKQQILEHETVLNEDFSKEELGKLSLLWLALLGPYYDSVELLVSSGADVNEFYGLYGSQGISSRHLLVNAKSTVLHALVQMDPSAENERLVRLVVDHGADLQAQDSNGRTALHFAAAKGRVQLTEMLLEKGADVNIGGTDGVTPLHEVAKICYNANELLPLLIKHGANVFARDKTGGNILHYLAPYSFDKEHVVQMARVFIEMGVSLDDKEHVTQLQPIHLAIYARNNGLVTLYLDHGANVSAESKYDFPLSIAAATGNVVLMKTLLERGANVDQKMADDMRTTLHEVCAFFFKNEIIQLLLTSGANVLVEDIDGNTPFARIHANRMAEPGTYLMVKKLAFIKVCQPGIELKDEKIIEQYPDLWNHYGNCIEQVERMKSTRFIETCTLFELLTKCHCQIAPLMRNPEFEIKFKLFDVNTSEFAAYADEIVRAFKRAEKHHQSVLEQEDVINEAVFDILPYVIVRRMVHYICDCCENVN